MALKFGLCFFMKRVTPVIPAQGSVGASGDLDLAFLVNRVGLRLYRNDAPPGNSWIELDLIGERRGIAGPRRLHRAQAAFERGQGRRFPRVIAPCILGAWNSWNTVLGGIFRPLPRRQHIVDIRALLHRLDAGIQLLGLDDHFDLHLGQEIDHVFGAPIQLRMPLLAPEPLDLGRGHAGDADA